MRVIVQGRGVVGEVTGLLLKEQGHEVSFHDPLRGYEATPPADVCVVCTPCPSGILEDPGYATDAAPVVVVRSSVIPAAFEQLPFGARHHWPEFLTERTAEADAQAPDKLVWGSDLPEDQARAFIRALLGEHYLDLADRSAVTTLRASCIAKLGVNAYYTAKVMMANVLYDACETEDEYEDVCLALALDKRITLSHDRVHQDGYRGAGGKCLPKDTKLLAEMLPYDVPTRRFLLDLAAENWRLIAG